MGLLRIFFALVVTAGSFFAFIALRSAFTHILSALYDPESWQAKYRFQFADRVFLILAGLGCLSFIIFADYQNGKQLTFAGMSKSMARYSSFCFLTLFICHLIVAILSSIWQFTFGNVLFLAGELAVAVILYALSRGFRLKKLPR